MTSNPHSEQTRVREPKKSLWHRIKTAVDSQPVLNFYLLVVTTSLLFIIGLIIVFSASTITALDEATNPFLSFGKRSLIYLVSVIVMFVASRIPPVVYQRVAYYLLYISWVVQAMVFIPGFHGASAGGNTNWLLIPGTGFSIQPSEFIKLSLVLCLGKALANPELRNTKNWKPWFKAVGLQVVVSIGLVMLGRDLGTAMVMASLVLAALYIGEIPLRYLGAVLVLGCFLAGIAVMSSSNRLRRIMGYLHASTSDPTGIGYQRQHGLWSLATGGWTGVGPGASREKWSYLPEADTDYIFAIWGEEYGIVGTFLVLGLFVVLCLTLTRLMRRSESRFATITVAGITGWIFSQTIINIGAVVGILPIIGVPLPLISSGGSSLLSVMAALGVATAFSRYEPGALQALRVRWHPVKRSIAVQSGPGLKLSKSSKIKR